MSTNNQIPRTRSTGTVTSSHTLPSDEVLETLESLARDLWGEYWTIKIECFADGTNQAMAVHGGSKVTDHDRDQRVREVERIAVDEDGQVGYDRVHLTRSDLVEMVEKQVVDDPSDLDV